MTKHTLGKFDLPYELPDDYQDSTRINSRDYGTIAYMADNDHFDTKEANEYERQRTYETAKFLCHAANCHDDLLAALRKAAQDLGSIAIKNEESGPDSFQWINEWIELKAKEADDAIAKAENPNRS